MNKEKESRIVKIKNKKGWDGGRRRGRSALTDRIMQLCGGVRLAETRLGRERVRECSMRLGEEGLFWKDTSKWSPGCSDDPLGFPISRKGIHVVYFLFFKEQR